MTCFEALTERELNSFINRIENITGWIVECDPDYLLRFWNKSKDKLFHKMGDKLILEREVTYHKSIQDLKAIIRKSGFYSSEFIGNLYEICSIFMNVPKYRSMTESEKAYNEDLAFIDKFSEGTDFRQICYSIDRLASEDSLATNIYEGRTFCLYDEDGKKHKIQTGCKAMKALKMIAEIYHLSGYEDFRLAHSRITNDRTLTGTLCLSIHPLDFSTMSDNNSNWTSCMSWDNEGEYHLGTIEMMNSPYVIMGYLKSSNTSYELNDGLEWNSKKWRCLYVVNDDVIMTIKQYPYENNDLNIAVLDWIREIMGKEHYLNDVFHFNAKLGQQEVPETGEMINYRFKTCCMYNDVYLTNHPMYLALSAPSQKEINYSGATECMICGQESDDPSEEQTNSMVLNCCSPRAICDCCSKVVCEDNVIRIDGHTYCNYCFANYSQPCHICGGESHMEDDMVPVKFLVNGTTLTSIFVCENDYQRTFRRYDVDRYGECKIELSEESRETAYHFLKDICGLDEYEISDIMCDMHDEEEDEE